MLATTGSVKNSKDFIKVWLKAFALTFDGAKARFGTIEVQVNEAIVAVEQKDA
jgi:hypothetical protein